MFTHTTPSQTLRTTLVCSLRQITRSPPSLVSSFVRLPKPPNPLPALSHTQNHLALFPQDCLIPLDSCLFLLHFSLLFSPKRISTVHQLRITHRLFSSHEPFFNPTHRISSYDLHPTKPHLRSILDFLPSPKILVFLFFPK